MSRSLVHRANTLMLAVVITALLLVGGAGLDQLERTHSARSWLQHTNDVIGVIKDLHLAINDAETGQRGYLLTGRDSYLAPYDDAILRVDSLQLQLQRLTLDNDAEQRRVLALSPMLQGKLDELARTVQLRRMQGLDAALTRVLTDSDRASMRQIETSLAAMTAAEEALRSQRLASATRHGLVVRRLLLGGLAVALAGLLWSAAMLNRAWADTSRVEAEQRIAVLQLRASLNSLSQGVAVFGADRCLVSWNECFHELLDVPGAMAWPGTPYAAFVEHLAPDGIPFLEPDAEIARIRQQTGEPVVYERTRADGHQLELRRSRMPDGGIVLTVTDMTRRVQAEAALRESQKMQAVGQLTGGIAHDFNNLLTVILGNLEMIQARIAGDLALQARIERATSAAQRGAALTAQLLAFARRQPLAPATIDLAAAVPRLVPMMRRTLGAQIDIRYLDTGGLWHAMADPAQLETAVLSLALNARDAMPGGGRLTIEMANMVLDADYARAHHDVIPGDYVMLTVADTGDGMVPDVLARVFEPFFTTKPEGKGTGLGLAMVFGFVKQSGGHIRIASRPGEGTTVRIYLPRAAGPVEPPSATSQRAPAGHATVLVVEDEPSVREIAVAILADLGYRVLEAPDGEAALRVFQANAAAIDLLLTDMVLPGEVDGRALAGQVLAARPQVKVLYMSGYTEQDAAQDVGAQLIGKPFSRDELARQVARRLGWGDATRPDTMIELQ